MGTNRSTMKLYAAPAGGATSTMTVTIQCRNSLEKCQPRAKVDSMSNLLMPLGCWMAYLRPRSCSRGANLLLPVLDYCTDQPCSWLKTQLHTLIYSGLRKADGQNVSNITQGNKDRQTPSGCAISKDIAEENARHNNLWLGQIALGNGRKKRHLCCY